MLGHDTHLFFWRVGQGRIFPKRNVKDAFVKPQIKNENEADHFIEGSILWLIVEQKLNRSYVIS